MCERRGDCAALRINDGEQVDVMFLTGGNRSEVDVAVDQGGKNKHAIPTCPQHQFVSIVGIDPYTADIALVPFLLEGAGGDPKLNQADQIHPNVEGHKIVAENVWRILEPLLKELTGARLETDPGVPSIGSAQCPVNPCSNHRLDR